MDIVNIIKRLKELQVFKYSSKRAVINIVGADARDFLQRMSTNDMGALALGRATQSCFLNNKGRIVDYVTVLVRELNSYAMVSSFTDPERLLDWLRQFHFIEDFSLSIASENSEWIIAGHGQLENPLWRSPDFDLALSIGINNYPELDNKAWELIRISALMPQEPEVNLGLMPQNIGLKALIAETKGCYLGQEVVAKALTYQKHAKIIAGVKLSPEIFMSAKVGDRIKDFSSHAGVITSLASLYVPECAQALAVVDDKLQSDDLPAEFIFAKN
jgi:folate-binding protein YgfZ